MQATLIGNDVFSCTTYSCHSPQHSQSNACKFLKITKYNTTVGCTGMQLIETVCYKMKGCRFDSQWGHWDFLLT